MSKIKLFNSILIMLVLLAVLVTNVSAETTFFDQDNAFIMADANAANGTTGGITGTEQPAIKHRHQPAGQNITGEVSLVKPPYSAEEKPAATPNTAGTETSKIKTLVAGGAVPLSITWISLIMVIVAFLSWKGMKRNRRT